MARDRKNFYLLITVLKILSPILFAVFILAANIVVSGSNKEGSFTILNDEEYTPLFVHDVTQAEKSITCALFMYKIDDYNMDNLHEPLPLITSSLINAAKKGVNVTLIFEKSKYKDDLSNKYNEKTAKYLKDNGINIIYDNIDKKLHAKLCLIDNKIIYTGSHNFTYSAMMRNSESSVRIISKEEAEEISEYFKKIL